MSTVRRIAKNTLVLLVAQIVSMGLGFFYIMYTARYLGAEGFGLLSFALAFTGMFGLFTEMGLSQVTVREVARDKTLAEKYMGNILSIKILLGIFTILSLFIVINLLNRPPQTVILVFLIGLSIIIGIFNRVFYSIYQAFEKMEFQSIGQIINSILLLSGAIIVIYFGYGIVAFGLLYFACSSINLIYNVVVSISKFTKPTFKSDIIFWIELLKEAFPFAITGISISIYIWIDTVMLALLKGNEAVGWYNAAYRLIVVLLFIPIIFNSAVFPSMSQYFITSKDFLEISFEKLFKSMVFIGLPIGIGMVFIADRIILMIYGDQFINSVVALQILVWSLVLIFSRSAFERLLESINKQVMVTKIFAIGACFNITANLVLIPMYNYIGAGIATVLTDLIVLICLIFVTNNLGYTISKTGIYCVVKIIIACAIMGIVLAYLENLNLLISIVGAVIIYLICAASFKIFDAHDVALIKSILK